ncbi:MAG TPA: hypothetical protein VFQ96_06525 [Microbacteriaceae bacterium]|nr:hypothetical protein [Microbacteriaceae bacterium]
MSLVGEPPSRFTCSRAGCESPATWRIRWRNPKIHTPDRVKIWLACPEHIGYLRSFLGTRSFPMVVDDRLEDPPDPIPDATGDE